MTSSTANRPSVRANHPLATEFALVLAAIAGFNLLQRVVSRYSAQIPESLPFSGGLLFDGLVTGGLLLFGLVLFTGVYVRVRSVEVALSLPSKNDRPSAGLALAAPAVLVGLTKLVGDLTGVPYNSLTMTTYAAKASIEPFLVLSTLIIFVGVPSYLLLCQVLVQGSFRREVGGNGAVVLTTVVMGFLLTDSSGGLTPFAAKGKLFGALAFVLAVGVALYGTERVETRCLRYLSYVPATLFVVAVVVSAIVAVGSAAAVLFALTQIAVLGLAAYTYERTRSLVVPALAYASYALTSQTVVFALEAGMKNW